MTICKDNLKAVVLYMGLFRAREFSPWKIPVRKSQNFPQATY